MDQLFFQPGVLIVFYENICISDGSQEGSKLQLLNLSFQPASAQLLSELRVGDAEGPPWFL